MGSQTRRAADMAAARILVSRSRPHAARPHTVFQLLKQHYARYTPKMVEQIRHAVTVSQSQRHPGK
jgi:hypothetical protein